MIQPIIRFAGISKHFPGVRALHEVSFSVMPGEVHAIIGENGAGKSTLNNLLAGEFLPTAGKILIDGREVSLRSPIAARRAGIALVYQELNLCQNLTVAGSIFLGREYRRLGVGLDWPRMEQESRGILTQLGLDIDPSRPVGALNMAQQQMVELAKALSLKARIVVLDEPTSALTEQEVERLFQVVRTLKQHGVTFLFVSHRMAEVMVIADRVTVLRDGQYVRTVERSDTSPEALVSMMVGRELTERQTESPPVSGQPVLKVDHLSGPGFADVSLEVRPGEIVGLAGLPGAGREELIRALFGLKPQTGGTVECQGAPVRVAAPPDAIRAGIGFVPGDRRREGALLAMQVGQNVGAVRLRAFAAGGFIRSTRLADLTHRYIRELKIRTYGPRQVMGTLSGGNQQKVIFARWLSVNPKLMLLEEPTRGVDVGAKAEIYRLMRDFAAQGMGMLMLSSELPELMGLCHRIYVMHNGRIVREFQTSGVTESMIIAAATGVQQPTAG